MAFYYTFSSTGVESFIAYQATNGGFIDTFKCI